MCARNIPFACGVCSQLPSLCYLQTRRTREKPTARSNVTNADIDTNTRTTNNKQQQ